MTLLLCPGSTKTLAISILYVFNGPSALSLPFLSLLLLVCYAVLFVSSCCKRLSARSEMRGTFAHTLHRENSNERLHRTLTHGAA